MTKPTNEGEQRIMTRQEASNLIRSCECQADIERVTGLIQTDARHAALTEAAAVRSNAREDSSEYSQGYNQAQYEYESRIIYLRDKKP